MNIFRRAWRWLTTPVPPPAGEEGSPLSPSAQNALLTSMGLPPVMAPAPPVDPPSELAAEVEIPQ